MKAIKLRFFTVYNRLRQSLLASVEYSLSHTAYIGLVGTIGFPLYYWIWSYAFPQPYENLTLRLIGSLLFLGLLLLKFWPDWLRPYTNLYWFVSMTYALPFFFIYMLLMNNGNIVWAMSTMASLSLLILVAYDWALTMSMFFVGLLLALLAYMLTAATFVLNPNSSPKCDTFHLKQLSIFL